MISSSVFFFFQAEDGIRDYKVTGVQTCALPISDGALSVSDLAQALRQSEPRVSRHLKILCEAGLLVRLRHGQWVDYRLTEGLEAASFVRGLLAQLDRSDPVLVRDRAGPHAGAVPR